MTGFDVASRPIPPFRRRLVEERRLRSSPLKLLTLLVVRLNFSEFREKGGNRRLFQQPPELLSLGRPPFVEWAGILGRAVAQAEGAPINFGPPFDGGHQRPKSDRFRGLSQLDAATRSAKGPDKTRRGQSLDDLGKIRTGKICRPSYIVHRRKLARGPAGQVQGRSNGNLSSTSVEHGTVQNKN
jgi:hypothetical protein